MKIALLITSLMMSASSWGDKPNFPVPSLPFTATARSGFFPQKTSNPDKTDDVKNINSQDLEIKNINVKSNTKNGRAEGPGTTGGGIAIQCSDKVYLADTFQFKNSDSRNLHLLQDIESERQGIKAVLKSVKSVDPDFADFLERSLQELNFNEVANLDLLGNDNYGDAPHGCEKVQLAIQYINAGYVNYNKTLFKQLSPADQAFFKLHEAYIRLSQGNAPYSREKVASLASSEPFINALVNADPLHHQKEVAIPLCEANFSRAPIVEMEICKTFLPAFMKYEAWHTSADDFAANPNLMRETIVRTLNANFMGSFVELVKVMKLYGYKVDTSRSRPPNDLPINQFIQYVAHCFTKEDFGDDGILRNSDGSIFTATAEDALKACPEGTHLPSVRELAREIQKYGARGPIEMSHFVEENLPSPVVEELIKAPRQDGSYDIFMVSNKGYKSPYGPKGYLWFWSATTCGRCSEKETYMVNGSSGSIHSYYNDMQGGAVRCFPGPAIKSDP